MARSRSGARLVAAAAAFLLPIAFSTSVSAEAWTPRVAVLLVVAAFGLPRIVPLLKSEARDPALTAIVFLAIAALGTALSPQPILSLFGLYNWGTGLLFVAALVGTWALGVSVGESDVELVERALVAGILVNALVATVQGALSLDTTPFARYEGRAAGLLGNPVHLGTLMLGGLALVLPRVRTTSARWAAAVAVVAAALQLSGSRFALALALVVGVVELARWRRQALRAVGALGLGLLLGVGIGALGGAATGSGRVQAGGENVGTTARLQAWDGAAHAVAHRPVVGAGPGRFRAATSRYRTLALVHSEGPDRLFLDAHNIFVEYATTTGLLGVTAFAAWLVLACRRARGSLLTFALLVLAMHLVEPQSPGITPLAFLALGVAGRTAVAALGRLTTVPTAVLCLAAVACAARLLYGDFELRQAALDTRPGAAQAAVDALPPWSEPAAVAGRIALYRSVTTRERHARSETLRWDALATRRDGSDPAVWSALAEAELYFGEPATARQTFREALRWDPWSIRALNGLANAALATGDRGAAKAALERSLEADPHQRRARAQLNGL